MGSLRLGDLLAEPELKPTSAGSKAYFLSRSQGLSNTTISVKSYICLPITKLHMSALLWANPTDSVSGMSPILTPFSALQWLLLYIPLSYRLLCGPSQTDFTSYILFPLHSTLKENYSKESKIYNLFNQYFLSTWYTRLGFL